MKFFRIALWNLLILLALLAGALAYLPFYLQNHQALLADAATRALGRKVEIDGVRLAWSLRPAPELAVALEGLRVHNPDWAQRPQLLTAAQVDLQFDLRALLRRSIVVEGLVVHGGDLHLETGADGQENWRFGAAAGDDDDSGAAGLLRLVSLRAVDSTIAFQPASTSAPTPAHEPAPAAVSATGQAVVSAPARTWRIAVTRLDLNGLGSGQPALDAELLYAQTPISLTGGAGQTDASMPERWPFQVEARAGGSELQIQGSAGAAFDLADLRAAVAAQGPTLAPLGHLFGTEGLPAGPFKVGFQLTHGAQGTHLSGLSGTLDSRVLPAPVSVTAGDASWTANGRWSLALKGRLGTLPATLKLSPAAGRGDTGSADRHLAISATLADGDFDGSLRPASETARALLSGRLRLGSIALDKIAAGDIPGPALKSKAAPPAKAGGQQPGAAWRDKALPFAALSRFNADLALSAKTLSWQRVSVTTPRAHLLLDNGRLRLEQVEAKLPGLSLTGQASLDAAARSPALRLSLHADRVDLSPALGLLAKPPKIDGTVDGLDVSLQTHGDTPAALIRGLGGKLTAASVQARLPAGKGRELREVRLQAPRIDIEPGKSVGLSTGVRLASQSFDLTLTGGSLTDLLWQAKPWPRIALTARGGFAGQELAIKGHVGTLAAVVAGRDLMLDIALVQPTPEGPDRGKQEPGRLAASVEGRLARLGDLDGSRLQFKASGPSLAALSPLVQVDLPAQPFSIAARLEGRPHRLDVMDLKATSAESDISGQLRIAFGAQPRLDALLTAQLLDLTGFIGPSAPGVGGHSDDATGGAAAAEARPLTKGYAAAWQSKAVQPLPLEGLKRLDAEFHLSAGHVRLGDFGVDDARVDATLDAGHLVLTARAGQERLSLNLDLRPEQSRWRVDLRHRGSLDLSWLIEAENQHALSHVPIAVDLHLNSIGDSLQNLLDSTDGQVELVLGAGQMAPVAARLPLGGVLFALLDALHPVALREEAESLRCAVFDFDIADGIATSQRGLAVQTGSLNVLGGGAIDLRNSEIELHFKTAKRKGVGLNLLGIADKFVYITGTLQHPRAAFDAKDLALYGGAAWASGGLTLVYDQIVQRLSGLGNPCDQVMRKRDRQ